MIATGLPNYDNAIWIALGASSLTIALHFLVMRSRGITRADNPRVCRICRITHAIMLLSILALAGTAFYSVFVHGHMAHWLLLTHVVVGGAFVVLLAITALMFAPACRRSDRRLSAPAKLTFWLVLVTGTVSSASMLLSMLPIFGTENLEQLLDLHRWSGLCLAIAAMTHGYLVLSRVETAAKRPERF